MSLPELSVRRHVLACMLSAVLVLFGWISYQRVGFDRFPKIEFPVVSVTTTLAGANPEIIDASITGVIEAAVNSIPGIDHVRSTSSPGISQVAVTFILGKDIDSAFNEVQAKVNQVLRRLPEQVDPPVIAKVEAGATPIFRLALQGDRTLQQLNQYARKVLKKSLETIDGVGEVQVNGRRDRTIRVNLDVQRMAALRITPQDLRAAFQREHLQLPGGFLVSRDVERLLKLDLEYHSPHELEWMIVAERDGTPIRLRDLADVEDGLEDFRQLANFNGQPTVSLGILKVADANSVAIIQEIKRRMHEELIPQLPPGMQLSVSTDDAGFILEMIHALQEHVLAGTLLAAAVVWLFLRSGRSTVIISLAIPVSLCGAVAVIYFAGFTFNTMTLLALLLLVGVVVDDAIVVLENIYRCREAGDLDPQQAAIIGTHQVVFAVLAATLSLVCIFAPVIFLGGILGRFFQSFAVVTTFGVLASWFVSMTLTPMLCARFLRVAPPAGGLVGLLERWFQGLERSYRRLLGIALRHRWAVVLVTLAVVSSSGLLFQKVGKGFLPDEDESRFIVNFKTGLGASIDYTATRMQEIEQILAATPAVATYFTAVGVGQRQVNQGLAFVRLVPREQRAQRQSVLMREIGAKLAAIPGVRTFVSSVPFISGSRGEPLQFSVSAASLEEVNQLSQAMLTRLAKVPRLGTIDLDLQLNLPELQPHINRTRAAQLGISTEDLGNALNLLAGGVDVASYNDAPGDGERYNIRLKAREADFNNAEDLRKIYLRARDGAMVRLDNLVQFTETLGPAVITRYDLQYSAFFYGTPGLPLGTAVDAVRQAAAEILPLGSSLKFQGEAEEFGKTVGYMVFAFSLAMVMLYMVLASQFNSFIQPLIIMTAQPLAIVGGMVALWLTGNTLNIYSMVGLVLLIGLVAKNSILLVDLTNQLRHQGMSVAAALTTACPVRMRPVLMTSLTIILALLPAALGVGAGVDTNGPLAVAVIGGMLSSTLLTLMVVPAVYSLVEGGLAHIRHGPGELHAVEQALPASDSTDFDHTR